MGLCFSTLLFKNKSGHLVSSSKTMKTQRNFNYDDEIIDKLSNLPDCVLLHILSFLDADVAVQTCILSKRWKNLWKILPILTLSSQHFKHSENFTEFVSKILSLRDSSAALQALYLHHDDIMNYPQPPTRIMEYVFSHDIQLLRIDVSNNSITPFPDTIFSCHTIKSLELYVRLRREPHRTVFPTSLNFPALTNLCVQGFIFRNNDDGCVDPFSTLKKLNSLIIKWCTVLDNEILCISSATLAKLEMKDYYDHGMRINTGINFQLSTPNLCTFVYSGIPLMKFCGSMSNLSSVKNVDIDVNNCLIFKNTSLVLLNWLVELANVESLTVSLYTLEVLFSVPDLLKVKFHSLYNLKSLKIIENLPSSTSKEMVDFLIQNAPSAKVEILPKPLS